MTRRVCYLARSDRGARIAGLRLVGERTSEVWVSPQVEGSAEASEVLGAARLAAAWVADRLAGERWLDVLCLDGDGGVCSWLTAPSVEASVVEAAFSQAGSGALARSQDDGAGDLGMGGGVLVQALDSAAGAAVTDAGRRLAVLAVQDTSARLFLDALDDLGIGVGVVESLWHAMARAWDRAAPEDGARAERVVATEAPVVAIVLVDPAGRLMWAWSHGGRVLTGGSVRLARDAGGNGHATIGVGVPDVGRLTADWLAWAAQLGRAPARIVCIVPALGEGSGAAGTSEMGPTELGAALGRAWPTATVDMAVHDDPIGATLGRLASDGQEGGAGLDRLTLRPGLAHRSLHVWSAVALAALGAALGLVALRLGTAAARLGSQQEAVDQSTRKSVVDAVPDLASSAWIERDFLSRIEGLKGPGVDAAALSKPVLMELASVIELLADYQGMGVEPLEISLDENMVSKVDVNVPSTAVGEDLLNSANGMPTVMTWSGKFVNSGANPGEKQKYSMTAVWKKPGGGR